MSGGSFDYAYIKVTCFADELEQKIETNEDAMLPETIEVLRLVLAEARKVSKLMRETEWLYSYDHSEKSFRQLTREHLFTPIPGEAKQ